MNIFKALSEGNGRISETNITSFMNYLLDSTNELNNSFFLLFLNLIDKMLDNNKLIDLLELNKNVKIREQIISFSKSYRAVSEPEYALTIENGTVRIPDILVRIQKGDDEIAYLVIENKIKKGAINENQIKEQYNNIQMSEDFQNVIPIYSILITPDDNAFKEMYSQGKEVNPNTIWLKWTDHNSEDSSIESVLRGLIKHELNAEIHPIDPNTQFIIKSFIDYLSSTFSFRPGGKKNFSINGLDPKQNAIVDYNGKAITIVRYNNNMIRIFDEGGNLVKGVVKNILKEIDSRLGFGIYDINKTTQMIGRDLINALNPKNASKAE